MQGSRRRELALTAGAVLFTLALLELALRIFPPFDLQLRVYNYSRPVVQYAFSDFDPVVGWTLPKGAEIAFESEEFRTQVRTNAEGYRDAEWDGASRGARTRVAILGDSFAFGWGVEDGESFASRLEALSGSRLEVLNFGVSGYSTVQELLTFEHRVLPHRPELCILAFYDNDVDENFDPTSRPVLDVGQDPPFDASGVSPTEYQVFVHQDEAYRETGAAFLAGRARTFAKKFLRRHSRVYVFVSMKLKALSGGNRERFDATRWEATLGLLRRWIRLARERGITPMIAVMPHKHEIHPALREASGGRAYASPYRERLAAFSAAESVPFLDVTGEIGAEDRERYHFRLDDHMTAFGHEDYARRLLAWIEALPLPERSPGAAPAL